MTAIRSSFVPARSIKDRVNRRALAARAGLPAYVDAAPIRKHIARLAKIGITPTMIARQVGIADATVCHIRDGAYPSVQQRVASAILSADHHPTESMATVLACGASRRLHALGAAGWPLSAVSLEIGMMPAQMSYVHRRQYITWETWRRIRDVYDRLSPTPGPSSLTFKRSADRGLLLPMEWEGYDIDDPRVTPPSSRRTDHDERAAGRSRVEDRRFEVARLTKSGLSAQEIAERLGVTSRTVTRDRRVA
jgi:hypothetical protein